MKQHLVTILILFCALLLHCESAHSNDNTGTAEWDSLYTKADQFKNKGDFKASQRYAEKAQQVAKTQFGKRDSLYGKTINLLGNAYHKMGRSQKALPYYKKSIQIAKQTQGEDHPAYGRRLIDLALLYQNMDSLEKALRIYQKAGPALQKALGRKHREYGKYLMNKGLLFRAMGNKKKAVALCKKGVANAAKTIGKDSPVYAVFINNVAVLYQEMGRSDKALRYYQRALRIRKKNQGKDHPTYGTTLSNMANVYKRKGRYRKALQLHKKVLRSAEDNINKDHYRYGNFLTDLAKLYQKMERYDKALPLLKKARSITEEKIGKDHRWYNRRLHNLASHYHQTKDWQSAFSYYRQNRDNIVQRIENVFTFLSAKEKVKFLHKTRNNFEQYRAFTAEAHDTIANITEMAYNNELLLKGLILSRTRDMRQTIRQKADSSLMATFDEWKELRSFLADQYSHPKAKRTADVDSLEEVATRLERNLVQQSDDFRKERDITKLSWEQIQDTLKEDEVAIEFITYRPWDRKFSDTTIYVALLLTKEVNHPQFIPLCKEHELSTLLEKEDDTKEPFFINDLYSYTGRGGELYELIWSKMEPFLQKDMTIYYSPGGRLHQLAMKAIPHPEDNYLTNRYNLVRLNSTRKIVTGSPQPNYQSTAMFGGIKYTFKGDTSSKKESQEQQFISRHIPTQEQTRSVRGGFGFLEGSLEEVETISNRIKNKTAIKLKTGYEATEDAFKELSGESPDVLHIATHGFFFADNTDSTIAKGGRSNEPTFQYGDDPLLRSGLALAGSNYAWEHGHNPYDEEDGILTAKEIANMDLSKTDLVVLSACETGLGEIKGSEGVYGLQRAFKMAGVDYLIMSLWKVPDEETRQLMQDFYDNWLAGQPIHQAFRNAQQKLAEDYPPYFWASFVLVGGGQEKKFQHGMLSYSTFISLFSLGLIILLAVAILYYKIKIRKV